MKDTLVSFRGQSFKNKITLSSGAKSYVSGDVIAGASNTIFTFGNPLAAMNNNDGLPIVDSVLRSHAREEGRSVQLNSLQLTFSSATVQFTGELWLFSKTIAVTDDAAFAPSLAALEDDCLGVVDIYNSLWRVHAARSYVDIPNIDKILTWPDPADYSAVTGQLFGVLVTKSAVSFAGSETVSAKIIVTKD